MQHTSVLLCADTDFKSVCRERPEMFSPSWDAPIFSPSLVGLQAHARMARVYAGAEGADLVLRFVGICHGNTF